MRKLTLLVAVALAACVPTYPAQASAKRSYSAKAAFARAHPCPSTGLKRPSCPGYVIDHVRALACGGADAPGNMQWQTVAEGRAKDRWERAGCTRS